MKGMRWWIVFRSGKFVHERATEIEFIYIKQWQISFREVKFMKVHYFFSYQRHFQQLHFGVYVGDKEKIT